MGRLVIDQRALDVFKFSPAGPIMSALRDVGNQVRNEAVRNCPRDTGQAAASIEVTQGHVNGVIITRIGSPKKYVLYINQGTGIYGPRHTPIRPVSKKALRFKPGRKMGPLPAGKRGTSPEKRGAWVFAASSKGTPPRPFLIEALKRVSPWPVRDYGGQNPAVTPQEI